MRVNFQRRAATFRNELSVGMRTEPGNFAHSDRSQKSGQFMGKQMARRTRETTIAYM